MSEMGIEGLAEELEDAALLLTADRQDRADALALLPAAGALGDVAIDHEMANGLLGLVVRRLNPRHRQEAKVVVGPATAKARGQRPGLPAR